MAYVCTPATVGPKKAHRRQCSHLRIIASRGGVILACLLVGTRFEAVAAEDAVLAERRGRNFTETLEHEGIDRAYHVHLPPGFDKHEPSPLVIALHGGGGEGRRFERSATGGALTAAADARGVVLVFPEGMNRQWCDGRAEILKTKATYDDVGFISNIIDTMIADHGVDPARVYATGISNGGFMSFRLAMDLSGKIAAVAPVTAQLSAALQDKTPSLPMSVMIVNGTKDPLVPYDGGLVRLFRFGRSRGRILSTEATVEHFRRHNVCDATPERSTLPDKDPGDGTRVEIERYAGRQQDTEVVLVKVVGGGHTWPGGTQYLKPRVVGVVSRDIDASEMILDFFLAHSR